MKIIKSLIFILIAGMASSQDMSLPAEKVNIYLINGKIIKNVRLWNLGTYDLEYESKNILKDVRVQDVEYIVGTKTYRITSDGKLNEVITKLSSENSEKNHPDSSSASIKQNSNSTETLVSSYVNTLTVDSNIYKIKADPNYNNTTNTVRFKIDNYTDNEFYKMGKADAKKYHLRGKNRKETIQLMVANPNFPLLKTNTAYYEGYVSGIKDRGSGIGWVILSLLVLIVAVAA